MADLGPTQQRYFESVLASLNNLFGRSFLLASAGQPPYPFDPRDPDFALHHDAPDNFGVPQPPTLVFLLAGMFFVLGASLRRRRQSRPRDRKSTRLNSSHLGISYAVFCLKNTT